MAFIQFAPLPTSGSRTPRRGATCPTKMVDTNTLVVAASAILGTAGGVALLAFTEQQGERSNARVRTELCVDCLGDKVIPCTICKGSGNSPINEAETCTFCDGEKYITCYNCKGSGIQPRYLDRLSPEDFMD